MTTKSTLSAKKGVAVLIAIIVVFVVVIIGLTISNVVTSNKVNSVFITQSGFALQKAEEGSECMRHLIDLYDEKYNDALAAVAASNALFHFGRTDGGTESFDCNGSSYDLTIDRGGNYTMYTAGSDPYCSDGSGRVACVADFTATFGGGAGESEVEITVTRFGTMIRNFEVTVTGDNTSEVTSNRRVRRQRISRAAGICAPAPDVVIVMDVSGSVGVDEMVKMKEAVRTLVETLVPDTNALPRVAVMAYSGFSNLNSDNASDNSRDYSLNIYSGDVLHNNAADHISFINSATFGFPSLSGTNGAEALFRAFQILEGGESDFDEWGAGEYYGHSATIQTTLDLTEDPKATNGYTTHNFAAAGDQRLDRPDTFPYGSPDYVIYVTDGETKSLRNAESVDVDGTKLTFTEGGGRGAETTYHRSNFLNSFGCDAAFADNGGTHYEHYLYLDNDGNPNDSTNGIDIGHYYCSSVGSDGVDIAVAADGAAALLGDELAYDGSAVTAQLKDDDVHKTNQLYTQGRNNNKGGFVNLQNDAYAAQRLREEGVTVITVGVGDDMGILSECPGYNTSTGWNNRYGIATSSDYGQDYVDGSCSDFLAEQVASDPSLHFQTDFDRLRQTLSSIGSCFTPEGLQ